MHTPILPEPVVTRQVTQPAPTAQAWPHAFPQGRIVQGAWRHGDAACAVFFARFDEARFDLKEFSRHAIACPAHIAASVPKRAAEFFHGRLCARAALAHAGLQDAVIGVGGAREPLWPAGVVGSITHGAGLACALVLPRTAGLAVGIDIERRMDAQALDAVRSGVLSAREQARLHALGGDFAWLATLVFSAKESFFKAAYPTVGRYFDFPALEFEELDTGAARIGFRIVEDLAAALPPGRRCSVGYARLDADTLMTACLLPGLDPRARGS